VLGGERTEMGDEILDCLVPADPGELAGAHALPVRFKGCWIRSGLYVTCSPAWPRAHSLPWFTGCCGFPSSFLASPILMSPDLTVPDNFRVPLHDLHLQTAARRTLVAHARPPDGHPRN